MMERETPIARTLQRIAADLGVPVASFYVKAGLSPSDSEAMQKAVAALLGAFAAVSDPGERKRFVAVLAAEAQRLRDLLDESDKEHGSNTAEPCSGRS